MENDFNKSANNENSDGILESLKILTGLYRKCFEENWRLYEENSFLKYGKRDKKPIKSYQKPEWVKDIYVNKTVSNKKLTNEYPTNKE